MHRPRFERRPESLALQLTPRDLEIVRHVARHRFLNSKQIHAIIGGSFQHILRRLQRLFHHGFLDRPKVQVRYFSEGGSQPIAYGLGSAGCRLLAEPGRKPEHHNSGSIKQLYLQHALLVSEVMIEFIRADRGRGQLLLEEDILSTGQSPGTAFRWSVSVRDGEESKRVGVVPDRTFSVIPITGGKPVWFFLEADRGTMPVTRRSLTQTSVWRKLLTYEATWTQDLHLTRFGCERFRVLVVTSSPQRARHLADVCAQLHRGRGLFLFTDIKSLRDATRASDATDIFDLAWLNAKGGTEKLWGGDNRF